MIHSPGVSVPREIVGKCVVHRYNNKLALHDHLVHLYSIVRKSLYEYEIPAETLEEKNEALNKMFNAQKMFEEASLINNDSLYNLSLNGFENNLGMLDIIEEYQNTSASNIAKYYSGISYLAMDNYKLAIKYLSDFHSDDLLLSSLAKGSIGDAFSELNQFEDAYTYYLKAAKTNSDFTSPMYLKKAGLISIKLKKYSSAKEHFENIKINFPKSNEAKNIDALISMSEASIE